MNEHGYCPHCNADWDGEDIPKDIVKHYAGTKYGRQIGCEDPLIYDGVAAHKCPDCGEFSPRDDSKWAKRLFDKFMEKDK